MGVTGYHVIRGLLTWRTFEDEIKGNLRSRIHISSSHTRSDSLIVFELTDETLAADHVSKELAAIESRVVRPIEILIKILR